MDLYYSRIQLLTWEVHSMVVKRLIDIVVSTVALVLLLPGLLLVMLLVWIKLGSPIFFRQVRPGKDGKPFEMIKLRTMLDAYDEEGKLLPDSERLTSLGKLLRSTSLDELPELWNVLRGDMSLVGPRPLLMKYLPYFKEEELKRFKVRPGITGLAQINGRNNLSWTERFKLDVQYTEQISLTLDVKIIYLTFLKVLKREDIVDAPSETMLDLDQERSKEINGNKTDKVT